MMKEDNKLLEIEELLDRIKPLKRHNIFVGPISTGIKIGIYKDHGSVIEISPNAKWKVSVFKCVKRDNRYIIYHTTDIDVGDIVVLRLEDEEHGLFLVESFLTKEEARELAYSLLKVIGEMTDSKINM